MPTHPRQGTKARQRQCVTPLPRCNADIKTPERTTSVGDLSPCNAITSRLPEGKSGLRGKIPNDGEAPSQPWKIPALAKLSPSKSARRRAQTPQLRWCSPTNRRTPPTQPLSLPKGEQLEKKTLRKPEETPTSYKSSHASRKLRPVNSACALEPLCQRKQ